MLLANFKGIYAVLSRIWKCCKSRVFGANFFGEKFGWCYIFRFLQLCIHATNTNRNTSTNWKYKLISAWKYVVFHNMLSVWRYNIHSNIQNEHKSHFSQLCFLFGHCPIFRSNCIPEEIGPNKSIPNSGSTVLKHSLDRNAIISDMMMVLRNEQKVENWTFLNFFLFSVFCFRSL